MLVLIRERVDRRNKCLLWYRRLGIWLGGISSSGWLNKSCMIDWLVIEGDELIDLIVLW